MTEEKKYIYAIISTKGGSASGGKNPQETQPSDTFRLSEVVSGINNRDVIFIPYRDIAMAVSNSYLINFDRLDKKDLTRLIAVHEQINSRLLEKHDIIPMRFGMIAENTEEIRRILTKAYIQFKTALEKVAGKTEFIVQVFGNEKNIVEKIVRGNAEIQKLKNEAESSGLIFGFSAKLKLGKAIFEALELRQKKYTADILKNLTTSFPDFCPGKLLDTNDTHKEKGMIMNYSFLIGKLEESALESSLNQLAEKYKDELKFKYIGPMAPYSFVVINLEVGNFDVVDNARKTLGLGEAAALPEIKEAYYKLAAEYHPDKHEYKNDQASLAEAEKKMKDISAANAVLTVYCRHYLSALAPETDQFCSFKKEDVESSIIISAKGGSTPTGVASHLTSGGKEKQSI